MMDAITWKERFVAHIKRRMTGPDWTDEDRENVARQCADASWPQSDGGDIAPEESADAEADEMHD